MCGIYGIWHRDGRPVDLAAVQTATSRLRHRGPDDEGYLLASPEEGWCAPYAGAETDPRLALPPLDQAHGIGCSLAFGFRRLAILDLSPAGHQPMVSADGRFWIVFNGEIYNYIELREELQRLGHRFRSGGDTEVILAAYAQWGEACLDRLNGMWAFAIWDRERRELFLTRDRFGVKPLYYVATGQTFAFASEIKALVGRYALPFAPEPLAIYKFLVDGRLPDPQHGATFFAGVRSLPPGHCMRVAEGSPAAPRRYYDVALPDGHHRAHAPETIIAAYRDLFIDAVRLELRSDVAVGTCLSGGIDSSSIVCAVNRLMSQDGLSAAQIGARQKTFSAVYESEGRYNERRHIERVLRATTADGHFVVPTVERLLADLERLTWHQDEPFQSTSIFAQWCVMGLARERGVTVLLDGQGADELLAGYRPYARYLGDLLRGGRGATLLAEVAALSARSGQPALPLLRNALIFALPAPAVELAYVGRQFLRARSTVLRPDFADAYRRVDLVDIPSWCEQETLDHHLRDAVMASSLPHLLRYEDRNSMAFSIEARVPFLDHRLVEFVFQCAPHLRIRQGWTKWVHRQAMEGLLPDAIAWRSDKVGFETPEDAWQRDLLAARPDLFADGAACSAYLDLPAVRHAVEEWCARGGDTRQVWRWISLEVWLRVWGDEG
jgi:asparagine synthase (glutamine-hydrolysing)